MSDAGPPEADRLPGAPHPRETPRLIGHAAAEGAVLAAIAAGQMPHAWLITGPEGIGKATLAWRIARFLLAQPSEADAPAADSLDVAPDHPVARRLLAGSEPGLFRLTRSVDPRARPARLRTQIVVEDVRALKRFFGLSASGGGWRAAIVDPADEMNAAAANALLKLLEEPPRRTVLLLVAHQPARLLPTIRSRCRVLALRPLAPEPLAAALAQTGVPAPEGPAAAGLAALSEGSVGRAFRLIEADALAFYAALVRLLAAAPGADRQAALALAGRASAARLPLQIDLAGLLLARLARAGVAGPPAAEAVPGEAALFARLAPDAAAGRRWADLHAGLTDRARRGAAANLDPATLLLDMLLGIDGAAAVAAPG